MNGANGTHQSKKRYGSEEERKGRGWRNVSMEKKDKPLWEGFTNIAGRECSGNQTIFGKKEPEVDVKGEPPKGGPVCNRKRVGEAVYCAQKKKKTVAYQGRRVVHAHIQDRCEQLAPC